MAEGLSVEGVLLQTRRVVAARWPGLLAVAVVWGAVAWLTRDLPMRLMMDGVFEPESPWLPVAMMLSAVIGAVGAAVMIGVVARTGLPSRPPAVLVLHAAFAAATVALALLLHGLGGMALGDLLGGLAQTDDGAMMTPLAYATAFLPMAYRLTLFVFLGMAVPAALERMVSPWQAAAVSLKLTRGHRLWLLIIAVVWSVAILIPGYAVTMLAPTANGLIRPALQLGQMLTAVGIGVLYLELRRLHAARAGTDAEPAL